MPMPARPLYALTIWPEWVYAILGLGKDVELRTWPCWKSLVGREIILHAGAHPGGPGSKAEGRTNLRWFARRVHEITGQPPPAGWSTATGALAGHLAAVATLGEPTLNSSSPWASPDGDLWAWPLLRVRPLRVAIPCRGAQGLWKVPPELAQACQPNAG